MLAQLNKNLITKAKTAHARLEIWDTDIRGLGLRVDATGRKLFNFKFQLNGEQSRFTLGEWPAMGLADARIVARTMRNDLERGRVPSLKDSEATKTATFKDFSAIYLAEYAKPRLRPSTVATYDYVLRRILVPALGQSRMDQITLVDLVGIHEAMSDRPRLAGLALSVLGSVFGKACLWGYRRRGDNPAHAVCDIR